MKTHWKKTVDKDWIGTYVLPEGQPIIVVLSHVKKHEVKVKGVKSERVVAYFANNEHFNKPMLLNSTNMSRLQKLTGTPYIEDWSKLDMHVTLCQEMDRSFSGGKDWALRISPVAPRVEKEELTPESKQWITAVARYKNSKSLENILKYYKLSEENKNILIKQADEQ